MTKDIIVDLSEPLIAVGGGTLFAGDLALAQTVATAVVAADSGADYAMSEMLPLMAVIGDLDSISPATRARVPQDRIHHIAEQDSTDFDKVLRSVSCPVVIAVGFSGGRLDHELAVLNTLVRRFWQPVVVLTEKDVVFHCPKSIVLGLGVGTRVSLFPMKTVMGRSTGLQWPIDGLEFAPDGQIGTSNRASAASVTLEMDGTGMLCVVPRAFIQQVVSALLALPERARWPVPAV